MNLKLLLYCKVKTLSWLLHHANRDAKTDYFYSLKQQILYRYGRNIGYDVQFIAGKKCNSCAGNGIFTKYYWLGCPILTAKKIQQSVK